MTYILLILLAINLGLTFYLIVRKPKTTQSIDNNNDLLKLLSEYKEMINVGFSNANKEMIKELNEFKEKLNNQTNLAYKEMNETINNSLDKINKKVEDRLNDGFEKTNKTFQNVIETSSKNNENMIKELNAFKDKLNEQFTNVSKVMVDALNSNLDKINKKVEERLNEGFEKSNKTFQDVIVRLSKIDEAQKKIESLSTEIVSLEDVLNDKKTRGTFGEGQLNQILISVFGKDQTVYKIQKKYSNNHVVDAALYMPDKEEWLSIDSKFPLENYNRMLDKNSDEFTRNEARKQFKSDVRKHINDIHDRYIIEGETAMQALMFIPAESIFSEILANHKDLVSYAQSKNVNLCSPTTLIALIRVLQIVIRDVERSKATQALFKELKELGTEFDRYIDRWHSLEKSIDSVNKSVKDVGITSNKISSRFIEINSGKVGKLIEEEYEEE